MYCVYKNAIENLHTNFNKAGTDLENLKNAKNQLEKKLLKTENADLKKDLVKSDIKIKTMKNNIKLSNFSGGLIIFYRYKSSCHAYDQSYHLSEP